MSLDQLVGQYVVLKALELWQAAIPHTDLRVGALRACPAHRSARRYARATRRALRARHVHRAARRALRARRAHRAARCALRARNARRCERPAPQRDARGGRCILPRIYARPPGPPL